jgi:Flp pilus assembly pilin Flp
MARVFSRCRVLVRDETGQDLIEYGLLAALISVVAVGVMIQAGVQAANLWDTIVAGLKSIL